MPRSLRRFRSLPPNAATASGTRSAERIKVKMGKVGCHRPFTCKALADGIADVRADASLNGGNRV